MGFYFILINLFILFIFGCIWSSLLHAGFLQLCQAGATLLCSARAHCGGFPCCRARALGARASVVVARRLQSTGSVVVAHGLSCSAACGIFLDQGSNPCPLHWQADNVCHQGSPAHGILEPCLSQQICLKGLWEGHSLRFFRKNEHSSSFCWSLLITWLLCRPAPPPLLQETVLMN